MLLQLTNANFLNAFKRNQQAIPGFHWCPSTSAKRNYTTSTENSVPGLESVVGLGLGGPEARLKGGPSDDVIIISQP